MDNYREIEAFLQRGEQVYMKDDFFDMALRIEREANGEINYWRKFRGGHSFSSEKPINPKISNTAIQVMLGGEFITKEEYDCYEFLKDD